jgi:hypothetical protein
MGKLMTGAALVALMFLARVGCRAVLRASNSEPTRAVATAHAAEPRRVELAHRVHADIWTPEAAASVGCVFDHGAVCCEAARRGGDCISESAYEQLMLRGGVTLEAN